MTNENVPDVSSSLPLVGIRVLDFAHMMQGPWAAEMLADLGADVIKVEAVDGGERGRQSGTTFLNGHSAQFLAMNRNKRSVAVNLKDPAGLRVALQLIDTADVLVQNFRPGVMDRLGLGWDQVREVNPRLVYCSASGYGPHAADQRRPGQDLLAQARTGALWLTGTSADGPTPSGPFVADVHAASMLALGATAALVERASTGRGRLVEVDLVGAMLHQTTQEVVAAVNTGTEPIRTNVPGSAYIEAPYGVHATRDGFIAISLTTMEDLAAVLGSRELLSDFPDKAAATARRDELNSRVGAFVAVRDSAEVLDALDRAGVWCAPANDFRAMTTDPMVAWPSRRLQVDHPEAGRLDLVGNPIRLDGAQLPGRRPAPLLGEHTVELLTELGLEHERDALLGTGAIGVLPAVRVGEGCRAEVDSWSGVVDADGLPPVGAMTVFRKTVTESDVGLFAGITGDFAPQHTDEEYMRDRPQGRRIAHGTLVLALTSTAAARLCAEHGLTAVSYGYDRVRFIRPVFLGDTVRVEYTVATVDPAAHKAFAEIRAITQSGDLVLVGTHVLYCYPDDGSSDASGGAR